MEKPRPMSPSKGPKIDQHALEREKRNAERIARENQRRALQAGVAVLRQRAGRVMGRETNELQVRR